ncbi:uncharacterized protein [Nicotiana tomentosiformis]|uniref:uncharacterized protein n=1 Tax=Nicotiana tomentosiformis TaxID=4098 RepID=UPI00388C4863
MANNELENIVVGDVDVEDDQLDEGLQLPNNQRDDHSTAQAPGHATAEYQTPSALPVSGSQPVVTAIPEPRPAATGTDCNMRILESHGMDFTTFQLEGWARRWWQSYLLGRPTGSPPMTWDLFTCLFFDRYIPPSQREELRFQFEQLQQGQMSVNDYEARFSELSRHAFMILPTDAERV